MYVWFHGYPFFLGQLKESGELNKNRQSRVFTFKDMCFLPYPRSQILYFPQYSTVQYSTVGTLEVSILWIKAKQIINGNLESLMSD